MLVGSRHTAESLWEAMDDPELPGRTRLGPPGVDVDRFAPREPAGGRAPGLEAPARAGSAARPRPPRPATAPASSFSRRAGEAAAALGTVEPEDRLVVFVGKLIASKGVELLLAAWPLVLAREPAARLVIVGFGALPRGAGGARRPARGAATSTPRAPRAARTAASCRGWRRSSTALEDRGAPTAPPRAASTDRVAFAGRLDHAELADLLPAAEAMAVTSTFPEAFGMVAAEAAACGALPVVAAPLRPRRGRPHARRRRARTRAARGSPSRSAPDAVRELADGPRRAGSRRPTTCARATREAIVAATRERYSWDGVARTVIAAAQGELDDLPDP